MIFTTGHTKGIGKALNDYYGGRGFSRSNDYDLTNKVDRYKMYDQLDDCTVFINNAFCYNDPTSPEHMWVQTEILYELYNKMTKDQIILSIGSNTVDENQRRVWPYQAAKAGLHKAINQLQYTSGGPKICSVRFGYVGTEDIITKFNPKAYVALRDAVTCVDFVVQQAHAGYLINNMLIRAVEYE